MELLVHSNPLLDGGLKPGFTANSGNFAANLNSTLYFLNFSKYLLKLQLRSFY